MNLHVKYYLKYCQHPAGSSSSAESAIIAVSSVVPLLVAGDSQDRREAFTGLRIRNSLKPASTGPGYSRKTIRVDGKRSQGKATITYKRVH
jgi:hypothetical protein